MSTAVDPTQRFDPFNHGVWSTHNNPWAGFFGQPPYPWKTSSYDKYDRHNLNLPEAYIGQNKTLARTVDELIYDDETWYTTTALPWNITDQVSVQWDKWEFNEHFTGVVPEQGVSRLVSSKRESRSESFVRRGLAAIFEHGFMTTPEGRTHYFLTLRQIARAVQETTNFGVIYAYLTCHDYNKNWEAKHGYFRKQTLREVLERERFMWAILQKEKYGGEKLDAQIVEWMSRYKASANMWIMPPKPAMYLRLVPSEKTEYYRAGQRGPDRVDNIVGAGRPHESNRPSKRVHDVVEPYSLFNKNMVYLTRSYHVDRTGPIDLTSRISSIGEFNVMIDDANDCAAGEYRSCHRSIRIYDEENDRGYNVSLLDALDNTVMFDGNGNIRVPEPGSASVGDLAYTFFLRPVVGPNGVTFEAINMLGDIDERFLSVDSILEMARTVLAQAKRAEINLVGDVLAQRVVGPANFLPDGDGAGAGGAGGGGGDDVDEYGGINENANIIIGDGIKQLENAIKRHDDSNTHLTSFRERAIGKQSSHENYNLLKRLLKENVSHTRAGASDALNSYIQEVDEIVQGNLNRMRSGRRGASRSSRTQSFFDSPVFRKLEAMYARSNSGRSGVSSGRNQPSYSSVGSGGLSSYSQQRVGMMQGLVDQPPPTRVLADGSNLNDPDIQEWVNLLGVENPRQRVQNMVALGQAIDGSAAGDDEKTMAKALLRVKANRNALKGLVRFNVRLPMGFLLFRPHMTYDMALGIKAMAGGDTGFTYFGHSDFQLADDAAIKVHYGHYTHYAKSVVHNEKNVFVAYDIFSNACLGGGGVRFIRDPNQYKPGSDDGAGGDIIIIPVPYEEREFPLVMDTAGRFYSYMDKGFVDGKDPQSRDLHYTTAGWANAQLKFYSPASVTDELDEPLFRMRQSNVNRIIWQGPQASFNPDSNKFDRNIIRNQSPWGPNVYAGVKAARDGRMREIEHLRPGELGF